MAHIADRIQVNQKPHTSNDQHHHDAQMVGIECNMNAVGGQRNPFKELDTDLFGAFTGTEQPKEIESQSKGAQHSATGDP